MNGKLIKFPASGNPYEVYLSVITIVFSSSVSFFPCPQRKKGLGMPSVNVGHGGIFHPYFKNS